MRLVAEVFRPQVSYLSADGRNCSSWPFSTRCKTASAPRLRVSSSSSSPPPISCLSCLSSSSPPAPSSGKAATHSSTVTGEWDLVLDNFKLGWESKAIGLCHLHTGCNTPRVFLLNIRRENVHNLHWISRPFLEATQAVCGYLTRQLHPWSA